MPSKLLESLRACCLAAQLLVGRPTLETRRRLAGTALQMAVFVPFLSAVYIGHQYDRKLGRECPRDGAPVWPFVGWRKKGRKVVEDEDGDWVVM